MLEFDSKTLLARYAREAGFERQAITPAKIDRDEYNRILAEFGQDVGQALIHIKMTYTDQGREMAANFLRVRSED